MTRTVLRTRLIDGAAALGLSLAPGQAASLERYAEELVDWNRRLNLTAITGPSEIVDKHFLDSLSVLVACEVPVGSRMVDVGSGAGFPGLPLRIARPDLRLALLEATRKKCEFLRYVVKALDLADVTIVNARAEEAGRDPVHRERYDVAVARAVAEMATLAEYLLPFVRVGGLAIAQKSGEVRAEVGRAEAAVTTLGGRLQDVHEVRVPGLDEPRYLIVLEKTAPTPDKYPRRPGMPEKKPLGS